jgi:hypothetical protein
MAKKKNGFRAIFGLLQRERKEMKQRVLGVAPWLHGGGRATTPSIPNFFLNYFLKKNKKFN